LKFLAPGGKIMPKNLFMKIFITLLLSFMITITNARQKPIRLIVRGDDMGYTHSSNEALIKSYREGIETSVEVIVAAPWFLEGAKLLKENPGIDVGLHLALTSEWDNLKWRPITDCRSLKDSNGYYFARVYPDANYPGQSISEHSWKIEDIEMEFRAQIELALAKIPQISHISSHMNCTSLTPEVTALTKKLAKEYHIDIDPDDYQVISLGYGSESKTSADKIDSFMNVLRSLEEGKTYLFVDHPGIDNNELRAVYHTGYENVAMDRQGVTDLFTSEKVKALIKERGIQLIGYNELLTK
jgi:predicted glycoside hydrolase/deacetylase ChbG (UPF0249 family)